MEQVDFLFSKGALAFKTTKLDVEEIGMDKPEEYRQEVAEMRD